MPWSAGMGPVSPLCGTDGPGTMAVVRRAPAAELPLVLCSGRASACENPGKPRGAVGRHQVGSARTMGDSSVARTHPAWWGAPTILSPPPRVLVAADDQPAEADPGTVLIRAGFEVVGHVRDSRQAVVVTAVIRPDLVVLEVGVPDPDAVAAIQEMTDYPNTPVVLLTTPSRSGLVDGVVAGGSTACLVTPFVPAALLAAVHLVLALQADRGELADAADLTRRLEERNLVEQAKGLLMFHRQMTEASAHHWLQQAAMHRRVKMSKVAGDVIRRWVD